MKKISIIEEILQIEYLKFSNSINIQNGDLNQRSERKECQQVVYTQHQMLWTMDYGPFWGLRTTEPKILETSWGNICLPSATRHISEDFGGSIHFTLSSIVKNFLTTIVRLSRRRRSIKRYRASLWPKPLSLLHTSSDCGTQTCPQLKTGTSQSIPSILLHQSHWY